MSNPNFLELLDRARGGEPAATEWLVREFEPEIRREAGFLLRRNRLSRKVEQSDICQSVMGRLFVGLYAGRFELSTPEDLAKLLKQMVKNRVTDAARYWKSQGRDYDREAEPVQDAPRDPIAAQSTASERVMRSELLGEFERRLTQEERTILGLHRDKTSWAEIASHVGSANPEAIRKRFERAVDRVCEELDLPG
jgi:DNA-directed RNA polymerase specialized sigma24 family protein